MMVEATAPRQTDRSGDVLKVFVSISASCSSHTLRTKPGRPSGLEEMCGFTFLRDLHTFSQFVSNVRCPRPAMEALQSDFPLKKRLCR